MIQSANFLLIVLVVFLLNQALGARFSLRKNLLLIASYWFYMCWDWRFSGLLLLATTVNYFAGRGIAAADSPRAKKRWLAFALTVCLGVLAYFKYANFFLENLLALLALAGMPVDMLLLNLVLPIGISFFTFQSLSYTLDVYRGVEKPCRDFRDFALFVAFFPTLLAGPITRARFFLPQLEVPPAPEAARAETGLALIVRGFIKKIAFANLISSHLVTPAFADPGQFSPLFLLVAVYAYSFQIYMDFSGYTDIVRGVAKLLGFELMENFNRPYLAASVSNFWQRWHISMSSFFRDYLFFSLGGSKYGNVYRNLMLTFVAIGFWHGAGWNFIVYGLVHGSVVGIERWRRNRREAAGIVLPDSGWPWLWRVVLTFHIVAFSRILFRAADLAQAKAYVLALAGGTGQAAPFSALGLGALLLAVALHYTPPSWSSASLERFRRLPVPLQAGAMVATTYLLVAISTGAAPFVYFQF